MTDELAAPYPLDETPTAGTRRIGARFSRLWHRFHLGALLAHLGLSVLFTWPLVLNFLPGSTNMAPGTLIVDRDQILWDLWWVGRAIGTGHNPFVTDFIWYPTPVSLYYHTLNLFNGLLVLPLVSLLPLTVLYNFIILFSFVMGGYGSFLLVRYLCGNRWAALVGSVVFTYSAYHIATMRGILQLTALEWVPFFVLFLLRAVYAPPWRTRRDVALWALRRALPAAFSLFLVSLVDWYYTMYALMLAPLLGLYLLVRFLWERMGAKTSGQDGDANARSLWESILEPWARIAACIVIYLVMIGPILLPTVRELRTSTYMVPEQNAALSNSADLLAFFQPPRDHRIWGGFFKNRVDWPFGNNTYEVYLTYTALFLGATALFATRRLRPRLSEEANTVDTAGDGRLPGKWFWAACSLVFFLLALGPVLQINGQQVKWMPMPYSLVERLPVLNISRSPDRFDMPMTLCLGVLAGYGINVLAKRRRSLGSASLLKRGAVLSLSAVALIFIELVPIPYVQQAAIIPRWYYELGKDTDDYSILDLPPQDDYWHGAFRMYNQTAHHKRIFGGYIAREFPHPFVMSTPGYQELTYIDGAGDIFDAGPPQWYSAFALYDTRYIVLQKVRLPEKQERPVDVSPSREAIEQVLGGAGPIYEDEQLEAYRVPLPSERVPLLSVGDGWEPREVGPNGTFRWMHDRATLRIDSPRRMDAMLRFRATSLGPARTLQVFHGDNKVFEGEVGPLIDYKIGPLGLPEGVSMLTFVSPGGTASPASLGQGSDPRQLSFSFLGAKLDTNLSQSQQK